MRQTNILWLFLFISLGFVNPVFSQDSIKHQIRQLNSARSYSKPLYIINNYLLPPESQQTFNFLNTDNVESISVFNKNDSLTNLYGEKAKNGVIVIQYKASIKLLTFTETLKYFDIALSDRNLKICVNRELCISPDLFIFDLTANFKVEVVNDYYFTNGILNANKERYINFITSTN